MGDGYHEPEGIAVDGDTAFIGERTGALLRQDLLTPGHADAVKPGVTVGVPTGPIWPGACGQKAPVRTWGPSTASRSRASELGDPGGAL